MFEIDWQKWLYERLLSPLRKPKSLSFFQALLSPVKTLFSYFLIFKQARERDLEITPNVRILRHWLNETFDFDERRFDIEDFTQLDPARVWGDAYNEPLYLPVYLAGNRSGFYVVAPCEMTGRLTEINAFVERYKLAGTNHKILFKNPDGSYCAATPPQTS